MAKNKKPQVGPVGLRPKDHPSSEAEIRFKHKIPVKAVFLGFSIFQHRTEEFLVTCTRPPLRGYTFDPVRALLWSKSPKLGKHFSSYEAALEFGYDVADDGMFIVLVFELDGYYWVTPSYR